MTTVFQGHLSEPLRFGHILEIGGKANEEAGWYVFVSMILNDIVN